MNKIKLLFLGCAILGGFLAYQYNRPPTEVIQPEEPAKLTPTEGKRPKRPHRRRIASYNDALQLARDEQKHLLVWVNHEDTTLEKQLPECVHFHCQTFDGVTAPSALVIGVREGNGETYWRHDVRIEDVSLALIKRKLGSR